MMMMTVTMMMKTLTPRLLLQWIVIIKRRY